MSIELRYRATVIKGIKLVFTMVGDTSLDLGRPL